MSQDDPTSPFAANNAWGDRPRPVFRISPLPRSKPSNAPSDPPPRRPTLAYVAPMPGAARARPGILTGSLIPPAPRTEPLPAVAPAPPASPPLEKVAPNAPEAAAFNPILARTSRPRPGAGVQPWLVAGALLLLAGGAAFLFAQPRSPQPAVAISEPVKAAPPAPPAAARVAEAPVLAAPPRTRPAAVRAKVAPLPPSTPPQPADITPPPLETPPLAAAVPVPAPQLPIVAPTPPDPEAAMSTKAVGER